MTSTEQITEVVDRLRRTMPEPGAFVVSRTDIVRYAGASGDFNPMHHSAPDARSLGFPDVFAMGLLPGGVLAAEAQRWCAPATLREVSLRFTGLVLPDVEYISVPEIGQPVDDGVEVTIRLDDSDGATKVRLRAVVGIS